MPIRKAFGYKRGCRNGRSGMQRYAGNKNPPNIDCSADSRRTELICRTYADRRFRPLARRALITARPPRVAMRARKP